MLRKFLKDIRGSLCLSLGLGLTRSGDAGEPGVAEVVTNGGETVTNGGEAVTHTP